MKQNSWLGLAISNQVLILIRHFKVPRALKIPTSNSEVKQSLVAISLECLLTYNFSFLTRNAEMRQKRLDGDDFSRIHYLPVEL